MSESREAPEAPQVETLENPNEPPAPSREVVGATDVGFLSWDSSDRLLIGETVEPQTLENPQELAPPVVEAAGLTNADEATSVAIPSELAPEPQTLENPDAPALPSVEAAGAIREDVDAPAAPPLTRETLENPHASPAAAVEQAGATVQAPPSSSVPRVPVLTVRGVPVPQRPRLRTSFWYEGSGQLRCELVLMTEQRDLVHRETFDVNPGSTFAQLQELLANVATMRAQHTGRVESTQPRPRVGPDTLVANTQPDPTGQSDSA